MTYSSSFFEISAQLIPVLFLALVVDQKLQPDAEEDATDRIARSWAATALVVGEVLALAVVAGGLAPSSGYGSLVAGGMLLAAILIALPALAREMKAERSRWEGRAHAAAGSVTLLSILGTLVAISFG
ncbi:hypothetical protein [Knoellia aerolata]|uniref:Uncharacterized protein n=1 Tax=Knoellia aerolata DSM 18566 TaxID=1385519 RepID=A0A0A0JSX9_9MICO|nr:hypothetical protein [Knoellia aerolata]KGN39799.1 hypothetical protein N801_18885 [Knoellia aerolata DSM 18566]